MRSSLRTRARWGAGRSGIAGASLVLATLGVSLGLVACGSEDGPPPPAEQEPLPAGYVPGDAPMRRLLADQYVESVRVLLGDAAASAAAPPTDSELNGYTSIAASSFSMTQPLVEEYETSARAIATAAVGNADRIAELLGCTPTSSTWSGSSEDEACLRSFVERFGRLAFRHPLTMEEVGSLLDVGIAAADQLGDFYAGVQYVIVAALQSPSFLFQVEVGEPAAEPGMAELTDYELASRMSLALVGATPDEALLDAVADGQLDSPEGRREVAHQLLADPRAQRALDHFFEEYLVLRELDQLAKDPNLFPAFDSGLAASMKEETLRLMRRLVWREDRDVRTMFTTTRTEVDAGLAGLYGVAPPESGWAEVDLPDAQGRAGVLTHASTLAAQASPTATSATHRGLFLYERFMCRTMPPPPEGVVTELPPSSTAPTLRDRVAVHLEDPQCAGCHEPVDTLGLTLETFDAIGVHRTTENGATIDTLVEHPYLGTIANAPALGQTLSTHPDVTHCMVRNLFRHVVGRIEAASEAPAIVEIHQRFAESGYRFQSLLVELVTHRAFRTVILPPTAPEAQP